MQLGQPEPRLFNQSKTAVTAGCPTYDTSYIMKKTRFKNHLLVLI